MKKIFLLGCCLLLLSACSNSTENSAKNSPDDNSGAKLVQIDLGNSSLSIKLPKSWEKLPPQPDKGIIFLSRSGTQNLVISNEKGYSENMVENLLQTTKNSLQNIEEISKTEDALIFRGKLSMTTPMREFYQKIFPDENQENFFLVSCSQEISKLDELDCPNILSSIFFNKKEEIKSQE